MTSMNVLRIRASMEDGAKMALTSLSVTALRATEVDDARRTSMNVDRTLVNMAEFVATA